MTRRAAILALLTTSILAGAHGLTAHDKISLQVTPTVSREPAQVNVRALIERDASNRALLVTAESDEFYRSSTINLEGEHAPFVTQVELKNLPGGNYGISAVLIDNQGRRSVARSTVLVISRHDPPQH